MEQETDFILREVKRLTLLISNLISDFGNLGSDEVESGIQDTDDLIKKEWDLSFKDIISYSDDDLINKLKNTPEIHIEKLAELLSEVIKKINTSELESQYNKNELANKGILLINNLNENSKIYSMKRMEIKSILQKSI